jgi:hypothetical protein
MPKVESGKEKEAFRVQLSALSSRQKTKKS